MTEPNSVPENTFKSKLAAGVRQPGLWLALDSPTATEILAGAGYDWLLLDLEHNCIDLSHVVDHLRAAKGGTAELMVRVPTHDPSIFKRLLDAGVRSFMVPMVETAAQARALVAATRYPPHGIRGVAGNARASNYNRIAGYFEHAHEAHCIVVQIESMAGIAAIEEIAAIDGIDGLFIGPNDLAASMGMLGQYSAPVVKETISLALQKIRQAGKAPGILNFVPAEARALFAAGFSFIAVGGDAAFIARRSEALLADIKSP